MTIPPTTVISHSTTNNLILMVGFLAIKNPERGIMTIVTIELNGNATE